jgi:AcrR family transcriptional regulator
MSGTRREAYFTAEIGGVAGVTRGTVYWRFLNKADLFDAKAQRVFDPLEAKVAEG